MTYGNGVRLQRLAEMVSWRVNDDAEEELVFVNVDDTARWVQDEGLDRDDANLVEALPIVTPPWRLSWYEYGLYRPSSDERVGVLVNYREEGELRIVNGFVMVGGPKRADIVSYWTGFLDEQGRVEGGALFATPNPHDAEFKEGEVVDLGARISMSPVARSTQSLMAPALAAITFLHCKNVEVRDVEQRRPAAKRKPGKVGPPKVTYKTLVIDGMKKALRTEGGIAKNGAKKAFHICRGHFAHYTEEKPLFGKVTGTFWRPQHTRGSRSRGEVVKSYTVEAGGKT